MSIAVVLVLAMAEAALRVLDPIGLSHDDENLRYRNTALRYAWSDLPPARFGEVDLDGTLYRNKRSIDVDIGSYRVRTNALGFRGPEITVAKPDGVFRILVLGDSVCFGVGVDDDVTFLRRWENELNAAGSRRFEVVNSGHPMYDTTQELALLRDDGLALDPDLVLLVYVVNDIDPTRDVVEQAVLGLPARPGEAIADPGDLWTGLAGLLRPALPATARLLELQSDPAARWLTTMPPGTDYVPEQVGKGPRGWQRSQQALLEIRRLCREAGLPLFVLDHSLPPVRALPAFCRSNDIRYFEFRFTSDELALPIRNSMLDSHANAAGNELLLQKLQVIARELPLPR